MHITVLASSYPRFLGDGTAPFVWPVSESIVPSKDNGLVYRYHEALLEEIFLQLVDGVTT